MAVVAGWIVVGQERGKPGAQTPCRVPVHRARETRLFGASPGSEVSRGRLPEYCVVEGDVGDEFLQASILFLELLQAFGLVELETAVFFPPALVGLLGDTDLLTGL